MTYKNSTPADRRKFETILRQIVADLNADNIRVVFRPNQWIITFTRDDATYQASADTLESAFVRALSIAQGLDPDKASPF